VAKVDSAHTVKSDEGVTSLVSLRDPQNEQEGQIPLILSGGADGLIKVNEYNFYSDQSDNDREKQDKKNESQDSK